MSLRTFFLVRRCLVSAVLLAGIAQAAPPAVPIDMRIDAPNVVEISPRLVTSGQPTAESLKHLGSQGFQADIYLAPLTVEDAVPHEAEIVRGQGLEFINIPINFGKPTDADFQAFVQAMNRLKDRKVLVHCQVNMRASSMTFLWRVIATHEAPDKAYESVAKVWSPRGVWKQLLVDELRQAGVAFEPY